MKTLILAIALIAFTSCDKEKTKTDAPIVNDYQPITLSLKGQQVVELSNQLGVDAFTKIVAAEDPNKNVMISPLSIAQALSMAWNGAKGETKNEMSSVLNIDSDLIADYNQEQKTLRQALVASDKLVKVDIANSIWYRQTDVVLDAFVATNKSFYDAEVSALDFAKSAESKKIINDWVSKKTNQKITEIVSDISSDAYMFIINAVYFLGDWGFRFDAAQTRKEAFTTANNTLVQADMMRIEKPFGYLVNDDVTMVELPYGNGHFSMLLMLSKTADINGFVGSLTDAKLNAWIDEKHSSTIELIMPKFKFAADYELNQTLTDMGMPTAFTDMADFSDINGRGELKITKVKHKSFIEVNEKGTEAAAVTSIEISVTSAGPDPIQPPVIRFDRPFVFAIREKDTGSILFMGKVANPLLN